MRQKQVPFNFQMPKETLENLRAESKETGVPVSAIIKMRIYQNKNLEMENKK